MTLLKFLTISIFPIALYIQFLDNPLVFDDIYFFLLNQNNKQPIDDFHFMWTELRSLPYATLAWTKSYFGLNMAGFRIGNLILHLAAVGMFVTLGLQWTTRLFFNNSNESTQQSLRAGVWMAALVFALHPASTYAVGYLVQRSIIMSMLFALIAMYAYTQVLLKKSNLWSVLTALGYIAAVWSKEHAIMLPMAMFALAYASQSDWRAHIASQRALWFVLLIAMAVVVFMKRGLLGSVYEIYSAPDALQKIEYAYPRSVITQMGLFFEYIFHWWIPNSKWMSIDMHPTIVSMKPSWLWLGAPAYSAYGFLSWHLMRQGGLMGFLGFIIFYPWVMFWTEFSTVRVQESFVLYRSYLWMPILMMLIPLGLQHVSFKKIFALCAPVVALLFPISMERLVTMSHPILLWSDAAKLLDHQSNQMSAYRIYYNLGTEYLKIDDIQNSIQNLKHSLLLWPEFTEGHGNLGAAYIKNNNWILAESEFNIAQKLYTMHMGAPSPKYALGLAMALDGQNRSKEAVPLYRFTCLTLNRGCDR